MTDFIIGDKVQVFDGEWSRIYKIYDINSPDDKNMIGYCSKKSYWLESLDGKYERTWFNTNDMRKCE